MHRGREGADGRRQTGAAIVLLSLRSLRLPGRWKWGPEAVELRLVCHVRKHVDLVLGVDANQSPEDLGSLPVALQEHAKAALHLQKADLVHDALLVLPQALQGILELPCLLHDRGPVHEQLGVLVLWDTVILEGLLVVLYASPCKFVALAKVLCDSIAHPIEAIGRLHLEELPPRLGKPSQILTVDLQQGQVSQDLQVVGIDVQSTTVALHRLLVVLVLAVQQAENVPADVTLQVVLQPLSH
mmetsp:Transcript_30404/g.83778  ORF Transcript_30404/g.83778 Transcript_30404/m.83778 type:complete len:242 (+) Transcript_30404:2286-3011(+)